MGRDHWNGPDILVPIFSFLFFFFLGSTSALPIENEREHLHRSYLSLLNLVFLPSSSGTI